MHSGVLEKFIEILLFYPILSKQLEILHLGPDHKECFGKSTIVQITF